MTTLSNKVAIITGASSGIGRATAKLFASEGARLVVSGRRQTRWTNSSPKSRRKAAKPSPLDGDVRDEAHARALVAAADETFGGLDIAFNNAGTTGEMAPIADLSTAGWQRHDRNQPHQRLLRRATSGSCHGGARRRLADLHLQLRRAYGRHAGTSAYAAAKAGLIGLTQILATELGTKGIRVNAILPGGTDTPMSFTNAPGAGPEVLAFVEGLHALKRMAKPEEIARSVLYLASDASSFTTGTAMLVDGGVSINRT